MRLARFRDNLSGAAYDHPRCISSSPAKVAGVNEPQVLPDERI